MPLTSKGRKIKRSLVERHGKKKGDRIFFAGINKGTFTSVELGRKKKGVRGVAAARMN